MRKPTAVLLVLSLAVLALALVPAAGLAAKGGNGGAGGAGKPGGGGSTSGGSLALVMVDDVNGNGTPNWGDTVTFDVSTTATSAPQVRLTCTQNGVRVYLADAAFYEGNPFWYMQMMQLESGAWTAGAADCSAVMYYSSGKRTVTLATLDFHVDA